ncbi:hypothetical protein A5634_12255 [Mycobacterium asiaticum]|uniref:Uncharacterized protein n=1 Tax=Mycobacterium asiaticum TaxID=1790 RepID=A0A1A3NEU3_MYCAS|nr:hypothetical protein [Mycobacterium asiaticum]OBK20643.1 hypothetical protein A5634_12255 [Mycobacterium asiaticum]
MKLSAESGLWTLGPAATHEQPTPLLAVLEVSGAVLSWIVDDPAGVDAPQITFTDPNRADWLWRVVGQSGHIALIAATTTSDEPDLTELDITPGSMAALRRLALGHWLRRWWPASQRDGTPGLDRALLDVEVALLTHGAQSYFTDDTLDSDVTDLLAPHAAALIDHIRTGDPRVRDLVGAGAELAEEVGLDGVDWAELSAAAADWPAAQSVTGYRDDYALAAGSETGLASTAISSGVTSINWGAVPPGIFDAAEDTVGWRVETAGPAVVAVVRAAVIGPEPATDIAVRVMSGNVSGAAALDAAGRATVPLVDAQQRALPETVAWNHDWPATSVVVGADVTEQREVRERIRRWVQTRLDQSPPDAFLAEILAAESAY